MEKCKYLTKTNKVDCIEKQCDRSQFNINAKSDKMHGALNTKLRSIICSMSIQQLEYKL